MLFRLLLASFIAFAAAVHAAGDGQVRFNQDIRPILSDKCFACHGFDAKNRKAGRRLDTPEGAYAVSDDVQAIKPGDLSKSEAWKRIATDDEDDVMPPLDTHKKLTAEEKALIKRWVQQGAPYQKHWAFEPPVKVAPPEIRNPQSAIRNPIDAFITDRLRREGLALSLEADCETLIRRVAFATTGLPPTVKEVDAFLADVSPDAYEKMVDGYMASPRYGEEMARHWLDVARYGDTHGLHLDNERQMWAYRDWVIRAFNQNLSFDQFTVWQLAGDLLPDATQEQLTATGFNRCNVTTSEGGAIAEEFTYRYAVDRTSTMAETWLGLTAGCAVCHDHKFDPISAKEFYSLYAFFQSNADPAMDGNALLTKPVLRLATPEQEKKLKELQAKAAALQKQVDEKLAAVEYTEPDPATDPAQSFLAWQKASAGKDTPGVPAEIAKLLKDSPKRAGKPEQVKQLREYFLQYVCAQTKDQFAALSKERDAVKAKADEFDKSIPSTFIWNDLPQPRESFVMVRGQYDKPGDKVEPATPAIFPPLKKANPSGRATRLDLARWLVAPEHPLTARVTVNRFWQQFFGTGLVKTSFDFGSQGSVPSHPELLDWLAVHFRESGWDTRALVRLMLTSATFRQSSSASRELWQRDPENRLYARGPRFRLDAEQIRDNALFVSGLMNHEMGGKGVRPYQPPNIWEPVGFGGGGSNTRFYTQDSGPALYRRSLYCFLKRTAPPPWLTNFDGPNREQFCTVRERSNTPLQALQLMNDVQHFEAARALGQRLMTESRATSAERIALGYRIVLSRKPTPDEIAVVQDALAKFLAKFQQDHAAAKKTVHNGESKPNADLPEPELAAWTLVANLILNLDETVTRN